MSGQATGTPVHSVKPIVSIAEPRALMSEYDVGILPVV
jgi:CBS domain-containing protein